MLARKFSTFQVLSVNEEGQKRCEGNTKQFGRPIRQESPERQIPPSSKNSQGSQSMARHRNILTDSSRRPCEAGVVSSLFFMEGETEAQSSDTHPRLLSWLSGRAGI